MAERIIDSKEQSAVSDVDGDFQKRRNFSNSYEVKLFQFSK